VRDATGGSTLPFRIFPGSPSSSLVVRNGNVGVGMTSPPEELSVKSDGTANDVVIVQASGSTNNIFRVRENANQSGLFSVFNDTAGEIIRFTGDAGGRVAIGCAGPGADLDIADNAPGATCSTAATRSFINAGSTTFTASSSRTIKENLTPLAAEGILEKVAAIPVYHYDFIEGPDDNIGLMAEDFHQIFRRGSDKLLSGQDIEMALWLSVQELAERNARLSDANQGLAAHLSRIEEANEDLLARLARLEAALGGAQP
jgi:hypothetical protein